MPTLTSTLDESLYDTIFSGATPTPAPDPVSSPSPSPAVATAGPSSPAPAAVSTAPADSNPAQPTSSATPPTPTQPARVTPDRLLSEQEIMDSVFPEESVNPPATPATTAPVTTPVSDPAQPTSDTVDEAEQEKEFTSQVFKRQVQKLIDKGLWQDVEGLDEMVLDEDSFDELARMQDEYRIEQGWQSVKQASPLVNDIFSIIEAGGNPEQILELHRDHQQLAAINTDTLEGKKELIARYYEDVVGFPKTEVNRRLKKLDLDGEAEIEAEFSIANQKYGEHFQKEKDRITQAETDRLAAIEARKRQKLEASVAHLRSQKVADSEIRSQLGAIYTPKWKMPDTGEVLSEFDYQLLQIRNDPQKSLELARFVLNRDKFVKELTTQATNQVVEQNYQKLKFKPKPTATTPAPGQSGPGRPRTDTPENLYKPFLS